jgi:hypothetical protein
VRKLPSEHGTDHELRSLCVKDLYSISDECWREVSMLSYGILPPLSRLKKVSQALNSHMEAFVPIKEVRVPP